MATADEVKRVLRQVLKTADLDAATEKSIRKEIETRLGHDVTEFKQLIKEEIDVFLAGVNVSEDEAAGDEDDDEDDDDDFVPEPATGRGRGGSRAARGTAAGGKRKAAGGQQQQQAGEFEDDALLTVQLSAKRSARVRVFKGKAMVDVREFAPPRGAGGGGAPVPTTRGLSLMSDQFEKLREGAGALTRALGEGDASYSTELSGTKLARVSDYGGKARVDLREHYEDPDGKLLPGRKGIALDSEEWEALVAALPDLADALQQHGGGGGSSAAAGGEQQPTAKKAKTSEAAGSAASATGAGGQQAQRQGGAHGGPSSTAAAGGKGEEDGGGKEDGGEFYVELSKTRRASISSFKGSTYVNIREYYMKDGELRPGAKGISLPPDQFRKLLQGAADLEQAVACKDSDFELQLSAKRKACVSQFNSTWLVNIREYYTDKSSGKELPGKKGISLGFDQWAKLQSALPKLDSRLSLALAEPWV